MLMFNMILLNILFNNVFIPEDSELLLQAWLLLLSNIKLDQRSMNVFEHFEKVVRECNMNVWTVDKLVQRVFIKPFNEMIQENFVQMRSLLVPNTELIGGHIEKLIFVFARAFLILTF